MQTLPITRVSIFDRIVCAFDGSPGSLEAALQADVLRNGLGTIELIGVFHAPSTVYSAYGAPLIVSDAQREFEDRFEKGRSVFPAASAEILQGPVVHQLLGQLKESHATLVAVGATDHSRPVGVVLRSVATEMLHRAPCSVFVARGAWERGSQPRSIVVGYDGSPGAGEAVAAGRELAARLEATIRVVLADDAASIDVQELDGLLVERDNRDPVDALRAASNTADLLVVGSRGVRGLRAIGSVSKQLGHQSACSILVVRHGR